MNLSYGSNWIFLDEFYRASAFGRSCSKDFCAVCGNMILHKHPRLVVEFKSGKFEYYRCEDCVKNGKIICETCFLETGACRKLIDDKIILFHYISNDFPSDIIHVILCLFIENSCCL
jgi:hypothetical protein